MSNKFFRFLKNYQVRCDFTFLGDDNYIKVSTVEAHNSSEAIDVFLDKLILMLDRQIGLPNTFRMLKVTVQEV